MSDRLLRIKANASVGVRPSLDDLSWLISELEKARNNLPAVKGHLEEIFERSSRLDTQGQQDVDWLIGQVAWLRQQLRGVRNGD